eukprot:s2315_g13.t1
MVQAPAPFATVTSDDAEPTGNPADQKAGKGKGKGGKRKKAAKKNSKKGKATVVVAGPEEEAGLALLPQQVPSGLAEAGHEAAPAAGAAAPAADHEATYVPGNFSKMRLQFIKKMREDHQVTFKEASAAWMLSDERADLLQNVPQGELKKRRSIDTLHYGQQFLKGKSTVNLGAIDLEEDAASSGA